VGARCILGEYLQDFYENLKNGFHPLIIGENSLIRSETSSMAIARLVSAFKLPRVTIS
jgi:hypothetical protein